MRLFVDSWRWEGVPFYVRAGKCLHTTSTEIVVNLKEAPPVVFRGDVARRQLRQVHVGAERGDRYRRVGEASWRRMTGDPVTLSVVATAMQGSRDAARPLRAAARRRDDRRRHALRSTGRRRSRLGDRRSCAERAEAAGDACECGSWGRTRPMAWLKTSAAGYRRPTRPTTRGEVMRPEVLVAPVKQTARSPRC